MMDLLIMMKADLNQLKESIFENIKTNINDQCSTERYFYNWSALDFREKNFGPKINNFRRIIGKVFKRIHI